MGVHSAVAAACAPLGFLFVVASAHGAHRLPEHGCATHRVELLRSSLHTDGRIHPQNYQPLTVTPATTASTPRRLRASTGSSKAMLTLSNTVPLRIHVDFSALNESTAVPYSACFKVGAWFRWNSPSSSTPPKDESGPSICDRTKSASEQNCWGRCLEDDVLTKEMRDYAVSKISEVAAEAGTILRVRKRSSGSAGYLKLSKSKGEFKSLYGPGDQEAKCAKDAVHMYRLPISPSYCTRGVDADVIFFPTMAQSVKNVAGWGGDAGKDQHGRPVLIVMGWSIPQKKVRREGGCEHKVGGKWVQCGTFCAHCKPPSFKCIGCLGTYQRWQPTAYRHTILHEITHGLGFQLYNFQNAYGTNGKRRKLVEERPDGDGSSDKVWWVVAPRTLEVAREYFNCSALQGVPLMGENLLGRSQRGSHWETRVLNDEYMAYGSTHDVSAFTLAMLEDLGHYVANYSKTACMWWGRNQGCAFVRSRCGKRADDLSMTVDLNTVPKGQRGKICDKDWSKALESGIIKKRCAKPNCERKWSQPGVCNAECFNALLLSDGGAAEARAAGLSCQVKQGFGPGVAAAGSKGLLGGDTTSCFYEITPSTAISCDNISLVWIALALLSGLVSIACLRTCLRRRNYAMLICQSISINILFSAAGLALVFVAVYVNDQFSQHLAETDSDAAAFVQRVLQFGGLTVAFSLLGILGMCCAKSHDTGTSACRRVCSPLGVFTLGLLLIMVVQCVLSYAAVAWMRGTYSVSSGQYVASKGSASSQHGNTGIVPLDDRLHATVKILEAFACNTYTTCCGNLNSSAAAASGLSTATNGSAASGCSSGLAGAGVGGALRAIRDPSSPQFCTLISGSASTLKPAPQICFSLGQAGIAELATCRSSFCSTGVEGYQTFVGAVFAYVRANLLPIMFALMLMGMLELWQLLLSVAVLFIPPRERRQAVQDLRATMTSRTQDFADAAEDGFENLRRSLSGQGGGRARGRKKTRRQLPRDEYLAMDLEMDSAPRSNGGPDVRL